MAIIKTLKNISFVSIAMLYSAVGMEIQSNPEEKITSPTVNQATVPLSEIEPIQAFKMKGFDTPLWICSQRITPNSIAYWNTFRLRQFDVAAKFTSERLDKIVGQRFIGKNKIDVTLSDSLNPIVTDTLPRVREFLESYWKHGIGIWDFYMVFTACKNPLGADFSILKDIEMYVLTVSEKDAPVFVNMGIARNLEYVYNESPAHQGLGLEVSKSHLKFIDYCIYYFKIIT